MDGFLLSFVYAAGSFSVLEAVMVVLQVVLGAWDTIVESSVKVG